MIVMLMSVKEQYVQAIEKETGEEVLVCNGLEEAKPVLPGADIVVSWGRFGKEAVELCRNLKWLFILSAGVEGLAFDELRKKGVTVTNVRGIHGRQMAEQAFGMMIAFSRRLNTFIKAQMNKKWEVRVHVDELTGKTLCIIGAGSIGREMARKARAFDMKVIGVKKHPEPLENFDEVNGMDKLHVVLGQGDYIVLVTPLTDETYHLMGEKEFKAMKKDGIFINMSRGDTVDEPAMVKALQQGIIAGAGLDVFHEEPIPADSPFWEMDNVIITPHNAGQSPHYMKRAIEVFCEGFKSYKAGKPLPNRIDPERKY